MQDIFNYDYLPTDVSLAQGAYSPKQIRSSQPAASFQRDFSKELLNQGTRPYSNRAGSLQPIVQAAAGLALNRNEGPFSSIRQVADPYGQPVQQPQSQSTETQFQTQVPRGTSAPAYPLPQVAQRPLLGSDYETLNKVRQVELGLIDFKGSIERRLNDMQSELPQRLAREINSLETREQQLAKDIAEKLAQFQDQHIRSRDQLRQQQAVLAESTYRSEIKLQELEYKLQTAEKQLEIQTQILEKYQTQLPAGPSSSQFGSGEQEVQLSLMRDQISQLQRRSDTASQDSLRQAQIFQEQMSRIESELIQRLKEQRDANMQVIQLTDEQKQRDFQMSVGQADASNDMIRTVLAQIERKVEEDQQLRHAEQADIKSQVEQKMLNLLEKLKQDERLSLERERRLMEQIQEGLQTMNEIIKSTKEHSQVALSQQTQVLGEQLGYHGSSIEEVKSYVYQRLDVTEAETMANKQRMQELEEATLKHVLNVNTVVETEMRRFDNVVSALEKQLLTTIDEMRGQLQDQAKENTKWRVDSEDITAKKITEIHQALKMLNGQVKQQRDDNRDTRDSVQIELKMSEQNFQAKFLEIRQSLEAFDTKITDKVVAASLKQKAKLEEQVAEMLRNLNVKQGEQVDSVDLKIKLNNDKLKGLIEQGQKQTVASLVEQNKKDMLVVEGKCQQYTVGVESRLNEKINALKGNFDGVADMVAKTKQELAALVIPKEIDEVALKRDQGERENALKEWSVKQLQKSYGDFDRLLQAKYTELLQNIQTTKTELEQRIPSEPDLPDMRQYATVAQLRELDMKIESVAGGNPIVGGGQLDQSFKLNQEPSFQESAIIATQAPVQQQKRLSRQNSQKSKTRKAVAQQPLDQSYAYSQENYEQSPPKSVNQSPIAKKSVVPLDQQSHAQSQEDINTFAKAVNDSPSQKAPSVKKNQSQKQNETAQDASFYAQD